VNAPHELAAAVLAGDRLALARAITLVESRRPADRPAAETLLTELLPHTGRSVRIGITGAPGVGKSTLIERLGLDLCAKGHRTAVFAVDPSSMRSGGSILGDKTRMVELSRHPQAFVRPSPGGDTLGGVAAHTREALLVGEAAGFDVVLVETIGTGQSETAVHGMVDAFLLLLSPAAGDELQGIKRGVMELADLVLVHKADGELAAEAQRAAEQCRMGLHILHGTGSQVPPVLVASSRTGTGIAELWTALRTWLEGERGSGRFTVRRSAQQVAWLESALREQLVAAFFGAAGHAAALAEARSQVQQGRLLPSAAARQLVDRTFAALRTAP
jgi:LAO/AO transport system kinase